LQSSILHGFATRGVSVKDVSYYEKTDSTTQADYLRLQCNCVLCNSTLELKFEMLTDGEIKEEATCPQCEIRTRAKIHSLQ
jgi:hypothetical protein